MRLINVKSLEIREFFDDEHVPKYTILSHRWGPEECTFQDEGCLRLRHVQQKQGFRKIQLSCKQTLEDGYKWLWVDSCCINKSSSAELSEAINSMYEWYRRANVCYVYLEDIAMDQDIGKSVWFTRGWTLQELLAPIHITFYDYSWKELGSKIKLIGRLHKITGIRKSCLLSGRPGDACIAERLSWISNRTTTRVEDMAYCLLGICGVNMPLLYGEGQKSFIRLQQEIMKTSGDYSVLFWSSLNKIEMASRLIKDQVYPLERRKGMFTDKPSDFSIWKDMFCVRPWSPRTSPMVVGGGVEITLPISKQKVYSFAVSFYALRSQPAHYVGIVFIDNGDGSVSRGAPLVVLDLQQAFDPGKSSRNDDSKLRTTNTKPPVFPTPEDMRFLVAPPQWNAPYGVEIYRVQISLPRAREPFSVNLLDVTCRGRAVLMKTSTPAREPLIEIVLQGDRREFNVTEDVAVVKLRCKQMSALETMAYKDFSFDLDQEFVGCGYAWCIHSLPIPGAVKVAKFEDVGNLDTLEDVQLLDICPDMTPQEKRENSVQFVGRFDREPLTGSGPFRVAASGCLWLTPRSALNSTIMLNIQLHVEEDLEELEDQPGNLDGEINLAWVKAVFEAENKRWEQSEMRTPNLVDTENVDEAENGDEAEKGDEAEHSDARESDDDVQESTASLERHALTPTRFPWRLYFVWSSLSIVLFLVYLMIFV